MAGEQHRHDISDRAWEKIRPHGIPCASTARCILVLSPLLFGPSPDFRPVRRFINGVFWILRTGAPWRDLPEAYGHWKNVHRRFCRWRDKGIWERILLI